MTDTVSAKRTPLATREIRAWTRSPGMAPATKTTRPSARAIMRPPAAGFSTSSESTSPMWGMKPSSVRPRRGVSDDDRRFGRRFVVVRDEPPRLGPSVARQILRPSKRDGLIPELDIDVERPTRRVNRYFVANTIAAAGEVRIGRRVAAHGDVVLGRRFVEATRQQTIVLQEAYCRQQAGGRAAAGVAHHRLVHLDLVCASNHIVVRLEFCRIRVAVVALDGAVRRHASRLEDHAAAAVAN